MIKKLNLPAAAILLTAVLIFTSCEKKEEELIQKDDLQIENTENFGLSDVKSEQGIPVFANDKHFESVLEELQKMKQEEREAWEKQTGFVSMKTVFDRISLAEAKMNDYYESMTEAEFMQLKQKGEVKEYSDIAKKYIKDDFIKVLKLGDSEHLDYTSFAGFLAEVLNKKGLVVVGKEIRKYDKYAYKVITDGDFNKIPLLSDNAKAAGNESVEIMQVFNFKGKSIKPPGGYPEDPYPYPPHPPSPPPLKVIYVHTSDGNNSEEEGKKKITAWSSFKQHYTSRAKTYFKTYYVGQMHNQRKRWRRGKWIDDRRQPQVFVRGFYRICSTDYRGYYTEKPTSVDWDENDASSMEYYPIISMTEVCSHYLHSHHLSYAHLRFSRYGGSNGILVDDKEIKTQPLF